MKDLKHLYFFERLLDDADNELVRQAQEQGRKCIGTICYTIPEVLLELPGVFPVRLRAPQNRLHGNGHLLHDKPAVRIFQSPAGAGH